MISIRLKLRRIVSKWFENPIVDLLVFLKLPPSLITVFGLALASVGAYFCYKGNFLVAGIIVFISAIFDMFDGGVARKIGNVTTRGALLDSVTDRLSESVILIGIGAYFLDQANNTLVILTMIALVGSLMVSYIRARSEGLQVPAMGGILTRPERVIIVVLSLIIGFPNYGIWILSIGTPISALQRMFLSWRSMNR